MNNSQINQLVIRTIAIEAMVPVKSVLLTDNLFYNLALDSLSIACVVVEIENELKISLPENKVEEIETVSQLIAIVIESYNKKYPVA